MKHLNILEAGLEDIPAIVSLVNRAYRGEASKAGWTTEADLISGTKRTDEDDIKSLMQQSGTTILLAKSSNDEILGTVLLKEQADERLYLGMLSVDPVLQGAGAGGALMKAAENYALQHGKAIITMQVISQRSELIAWYERRGYADTGQRRPFPDQEEFGKPLVPLEFVVLEKQLD